MAGTIDNPEIRPDVIRANRNQTVSAVWRWGPAWADGDKNGHWVVNTIYHVAFRVEWDADTAVVDFHTFHYRLDAIRERPEYEKADALLIAYKPPASAGPDGGPLTHEGFARLRSAAEYRRRIEFDRTHPSPYARTLPLPPDGILESLRRLPEPITAREGDWVREDRILSTGIPARWHLFTGDLQWHPGSDRVAAAVSCQVRSVNLELLWSAVRPSEGLCKLCQRIAVPA